MSRPAAAVAVLTLLTVDGMLCAVVSALLLPSYLGSHPFPISAVVSGLVNAMLVWAALHWTDSVRLAALPVGAWLLTVASMALGGPGNDVILAGRGVLAYAVLVLIVLGSAPPLWLLWRQHQSTLPQSEEQARQNLF